MDKAVPKTMEEVDAWMANYLATVDAARAEALRVEKLRDAAPDLVKALQQSFDFPADFFEGRDDNEVITITVTGRHLKMVRAALSSAGAA